MERQWQVQEILIRSSRSEFFKNERMRWWIENLNVNGSLCHCQMWKKEAGDGFVL